MESSDFVSYLSKFPSVLKLFDGVYSFDKIPTKLPVNHFIICNTDISTGSGKHWFCIYRFNQQLIECFDSLGVNTDLKKNQLIKACNFQGALKLIVNNTQIQSGVSDTCGQFCLMFIIERLHNPDLNFDELLNESFLEDCNENEKNLNIFFDDIFS